MTTDPISRRLRQSEVLAILGVSRPTLWQWRRRGLFPVGQETGPRIVTWDEAEVREWLATRPASLAGAA